MFFKRNEGRGLSFFTKSLFVIGFFCFILSGYAAAQHTISGTITEGGSALVGVEVLGLPGSPIYTDATGFYSDTVTTGWTGTVTPGLTGYTFTPGSIDYTNVTTDFTNQDYTASVTVQFSASGSIGDEDATPVILEISLSAVSNQTVSVDYAVSGGDATGGGVDYTLVSGTATISSGNTISNDISVAVVNDLLNEFDETIVVDLSVPVNAILGPTDQHTYTINDNDALPSVGFSLTDSSENEAVGTANLSVSLSELSGRDVEVDYSVFGGTATGGGIDYTLTPNTLTILEGSLSANIPVLINDDALPEITETLIVALSDPLNATLGTDQHTLSIIDNEALPTVQFSLSADNGGEGTTPVDIELTLSPASGADVDVSFTTGGSADGADYSLTTPSPVTIPAGSTTANITFNVVDDGTVEGDETVILNLSGAMNALLGTTDQHTYTINDNDALPTVAFVGAPYTHAESGSQTVTVTMTGTSLSTVTLDYATSDGTATEGLDYTAATGQLSWAPGQSGDRTFTIPIAAETTFELDETVNIGLSNPVGCTITGGDSTTLTITNDDTEPVVDFSSAASSGSEATSPVNLQLTMTNASYLDVTVSFTTGGSATGADYSVTTPNPVTITAGSTTANITLNVVDDTISEGNETVIVDLTSATNATLGPTEPHTYTINDNDAAPTVAYSGAPYTHGESGSQTVTVAMTGTSSSTVTVDYATSDGTATAGLDYTAVSDQLSWAPGETGDKTFDITISPDTIFEGDETVNIGLSNPVGCTITGGAGTTLTITDNDAEPVVDFSSAASSGSEAISPVNMQLVMTNASAQDVQVSFTVGGTATGADGSIVTPSPITITAGDTTANITLNVVNDTIDEPNETVIIDLTSATNATLGPTEPHTYTIIDDDDAPTVAYSGAPYSHGESGSQTVTVTMTGTSGSAVTVDFATSDGTATAGADYTAASGQLSWAPGETGDKTFDITISPDTIFEGDETVNIGLSNPVGCTIIGGAGTTLTITDNDAEPVVDFTTAASSGSEAISPVNMQLVMTNASSQDVEVSFTVGGTATGADGSVVTPSPITITAGDTTANITLNVVDDTIDEPNETVIIDLTSATNATLGPTEPHTYTIIDDDDAPTVAYSGAPYTHGESGSQTVTVTMTGTSGSTVTVDYATSDGTATAGADYIAANGQLSWAPGETGDKTFDIAISPDTIFEGDETVNIGLSNPSGCTITGGSNTTLTITDNDAEPVVDFTSASSSGNEATSPVNLQLTMTNASAQDVDVSFTVGGSATGADYTVVTPSPITITAGNTTANITLNITNDTIDEPNETVIVDLTDATNATLGPMEPHTYTINDNDDAPTIAYSGSPYTHGESGSQTVTVAMTGTSASTVTVDYATSDGTATAGADYTAASGQLSWAPGETGDKTFDITISPDTIFEGDETVNIGLSNPVGCTITGGAGTTLTITDNDAEPVVDFTSAASSGSEATSPVNMQLVMTNASSQDVEVSFTVGGSATGADGSVVTPSPITITAGDTTANITLNVVNDTIDEPNETVIIDLTSATNATLGPTEPHTYTIIDDDDAPTVAYSGAPYTHGESGSQTVTVAMTGTSASTVTVDYATSDGTATAGADYTAVSGQLSWAPGESGNKTFDIAISPDTIFEGDESVNIALSNPSGCTITGGTNTTLTITDNDSQPVVDFVTASSSGSEATSPVNLQLTMTNASVEDVTVSFTVGGTATGADYTVVTPSPITITAGNTTANITLNITNDTIDEPNETVIVDLTGATNATLGPTESHTYTINDNDAAPTVQFSLSSSNGGEGVSPVNLQLELSSESGREITVNYSVSGGTATQGTDYNVATTSPITIPAGNTTANITLNVVNDSIDEFNETVIVDLTGASNASVGVRGQHTYTINDNDAEPVVQFTLASSSGSEATSAVNLEVSLSAESGKEVTVNYAVSGGTADLGPDYTIASSPVTIPAGQTTANILLNIVNDALDEPDETVRVDLTGAGNASVGTRDRHTFTIIDNDDAPTVDFSLVSSSGGEGTSPVNLELTLSQPSGQDVTVEYSVTGGTATEGTDFNLPSTSVVIPEGQTSANILLNIVDDTLDEPDETIIVTIGDVTNAIKGVNDSHTYTITDNDDPPEVFFYNAPYTHGETGSQTVTVRISGESGKTIMIDYATSDGTATAGEDYTEINGQLTWNPGQTGSRTFDVTIAEDVKDEDDETVNLTLSNASNCTIRSPNPSTLTITDDDAEPSVSFSDAPYVHDETGSQTVTVSLSAESGKTVTVDYETSDGTATATEDYTEASGQLTWDPGETDDKSFSIPILEDVRAEDDETVDITLSNESNCTIDTPNPTTLTITDDDDLNFETDLDEVLIPENDTSVFSVRLTAEPLSNVDVLVRRLSGDSDITVQSGSNLLFTPVNWDQYQEVTLAAAEDPDIEDGQATIRINAQGVPALDITANEQDNLILNGEMVLVLSKSEGTSGNHFNTFIGIFNNKLEVSSFDLEFHFDDSMFNFVGTEAGSLTSNWSVLTADEVSDGNIEIQGISGGGTPIPASSQGSVIKIELQIKCLDLPSDTNTQLRADNFQNGFVEYVPDPCIEVFTFKPCNMLGDVDGNGNVTPGDAQMAFEIFLGRITPDICQEMTSDANCSGETTPGDSQQIFEHFLGRRVLPTCCAESAPLYNALPRYLERPDLEEEDKRDQREDSPSSHLLYPLKIVGLSEEVISVPVILTNPAGIRSFGFELIYPSELLEYLGTKQSVLTADFSYVEGKKLAEGLVCVEGESEIPIQSNDTGSVAILMFKVNQGMEISLPITILNAYGDILNAELIDGSITRLGNEWVLSRFLNLGKARQKSDGTIRVSLKVNTGFLLKAFGLVFKYSTENLTFIGVERGNLTKDFIFLDGSEVKPGKIKVGGFAMSEILELEPGTLLYLVFSKHGPGGEVEISRLMDNLHQYVIQNGITKIQ